MDEKQQSLVDRAVRRLSPSAKVADPDGSPPVERAMPAIDWRIAAALAALIALGPLLTIVGAQLLSGRASAEAAALRRQAAPQVQQGSADRAARGLLRDAVRDAPLAVWLDRTARVLPADARVVGMTRSAGGRIELEVLAPDPDQMRGALRADPAFAGFRETGQRRAGAMILITYRRAA